MSKHITMESCEDARAQIIASALREEREKAFEESKNAVVEWLRGHERRCQAVATDWAVERRFWYQGVADDIANDVPFRALATKGGGDASAN